MPNKSQKNKVAQVMREFKEGTLHSGKKGPGKGNLVRSRDQAIAIGLSEARKGEKKISKRKGKK